MLDWRNHVARKFRYRPGAEIDPAQRRAIENKYAAGHLRVARDFTTAQTELERRINELAGRIAIVKRAADDAVAALVQARTDRRAAQGLAPRAQT
jgi:multidrug resistance efflux pump